MFAITAELLTGRYVATDYADRGRAEWPPHPARLYSALAAVHLTDPAPGERAALEWLARLGPPAISASEAARRDVVPVFVPVNDTTVLGSFEAEALGLEEAGQVEAEAAEQVRAALSPEDRKRREKALVAAKKGVEAARKRLIQAVGRATAPSKVTDADLKAAAALFPEGRGKQPRTFPSVCPERPSFTLIWGEVEAPPEVLTVLVPLFDRTHRVGHSSSLVGLRVDPSPPAPNWLPDEGGGQILRVPEPGQLERLEAEFAHHQETQPRVLPAAFAAYRSGSELPVVASPPSTPVGRDWLILRRVGGPRLPLSCGVAAARALRGALLAHARDPRAELLSGHLPDGGPLPRPHLGVLPLPWVGDRYADGTLLGLALTFPRDASAEERQVVYQALADWEEERRAETSSEEEHPPLSLRLGQAGVLEVELLEDPPQQRALQDSSWCGPARAWATVTPIALDRNPGNLRSRDPAVVAVAAEKAAKTIAEAVLRLGLPRPAEVVVSPDSPWRGSRPVRAFPPFEGGGTVRVQVHAHLRFDEPVEGPLVIGAGRYLGLGLCRPAPDPANEATITEVHHAG